MKDLILKGWAWRARCGGGRGVCLMGLMMLLVSCTQMTFDLTDINRPVLLNRMTSLGYTVYAPNATVVDSCRGQITFCERGELAGLSSAAGAGNAPARGPTGRETWSAALNVRTYCADNVIPNLQAKLDRNPSRIVANATLTLELLGATDPFSFTRGMRIELEGSVVELQPGREQGGGKP